MNARDVANKFRNHQYTSADLNLVVKALKGRDAKILRDVVASYIKYADNPDEGALIQYLKTAQDDWSVHEIISGLSILRCRNRDFATEVLRYARGVDWDREGYAQIAAVAVAPRILGGDPRVQKALAEAAKSDNVVVRETAIEAAQEFLGTPLSEVKRGKSDDSLVRAVPQNVREWLGLNS